MLESLDRRFNKPWYFFRPVQAWRRNRRGGTRRVLPWGLPVEFDPRELHGIEIMRTGLIDPVVTEALFRLTDPGDCCLDVGANLGHMAGALAFNAGPSGRVLAFEPNPAVLPLLRANAGSWSGLDVASVEVRPVACSEAAAVVPMALPQSTVNSGTGTLELAGATPMTIDVRTVRLDEEVPGPVGVMKLDVEGHEASALRGAARLFDQLLVRDLVFEEHGNPPTEATELLVTAGYSIFGLEQGFWGPRLVAADAGRPRLHHHPANYLATASPERALRRFSSRGWRCLRPRSALVTATGPSSR